jgi:hypothetical protein
MAGDQGYGAIGWGNTISGGSIGLGRRRPYVVHRNGCTGSMQDNPAQKKIEINVRYD